MKHEQNWKSSPIYLTKHKIPTKGLLIFIAFVQKDSSCLLLKLCDLNIAERLNLYDL